MKRVWPLANLLLVLMVSVSAGADQEADDLVFLDNGQLRVGIKKSSGGGIAWLSDSKTKRNLVDHYDRGRLIQQSYYGREDGSLWNKTPWRYNPVQGGDWRGAGATLLELKVEKHKLYARTLPKHWASGEDLKETSMEQWLELQDKVLHVRYRFTYDGLAEHPPRHQEIPALFVTPEHDTLIVYEGMSPWTGDKLSRSRPGWPNESRKLAESWAAYVDAEDQGIGALVPAAEELTCYRFGDGDPKKGACSYFAPISTFALKPGLKWEYDAYFTIGASTEIRERFQAIVKRRAHP